MRAAFLLVAACGALACAIVLWAYLSPTTGINGTGGAALCAFGAGMIALGGLIKAATPGPGAFPALISFLLVLAILGCAVAAFFLMPYLRTMQYAVYALMVVALLALVAGASRVAKLDRGDAI